MDIADGWVALTAHDRRFGMGIPVYEQIQARKVKARLRMRKVLVYCVTQMGCY